MLKKMRLTENELYEIICEVVAEAWNGIDDVVEKDDITRVAIKNGFKYIGYHNTTNGNLKFFDVDDRRGIHFGSIAAANDRGKVRSGMENWTNKYFLKIEKPLIVDKDFDWECEQLDDDMSDKDYQQWEEEKSINAYLEDTYGATWRVYNYNDEFEYENDTHTMLKELGYDCIVYKNEFEDKGSYSVAMFNPCNIKLADAITYDDNGDEIPLEERFDTSTDDVRY